jgi:acetyl-CoA C-acetyltransferase
MTEAVIVSAVRTPTGKFLGALKTLSAIELGALVVREAIGRSGVEPSAVQECILGNVLSAGLGQNPARRAALAAGLSEDVGALTVNKVCGSGLKAVMLADQAIRAGDLDVVVAGGMESMSNAPFLLPRAREGVRLGHTQLLDSLISDGLWCSFEDCHMGSLADAIGEKYSVTREMQDAYAARSHRRAADAAAHGWFQDEIVPVEVTERQARLLVVDRDEPVRPDTTQETLRSLKPAFNEGGTVTAGNAPGLNDGAAALVVMSSARAKALGLTPLARIVAQATSGVAPRYVLMSPVDAIRRSLEKTGWSTDDVDLFEINEAFSVQMVALLRELAIPADKVNPQGGAVALGHAIGSSGARILTTLLHSLKRQGLKRGIAALCLGGGNGVALAVER